MKINNKRQVTDPDLIMKTLNIPYVKEYRFHPIRRWRFDRAIPDKKIGIEYEGGTWMRGRHTRGAGYAKDCEKYNTAAIMGWKVLRFTTDMIASGKFYTTLRLLNEEDPIIE